MISYRFVPISSQKGVLLFETPGTLFVDIGALMLGILILRVQFCLHFQTRALGFWPNGKRAV